MNSTFLNYIIYPMRFPTFFALFMLFVFWFTYERAKASKKQKDRTEEFWENETIANTTIKRNLDEIVFTNFDITRLKTGVLKDKLTNQLEETLKDLSNKKIANLSMYTNTDLKLHFGANNINIVTAYDDNYQTLIITINEIAHRLYELNQELVAKEYLEYAIELGSDISTTFILLANIYIKEATPEKVLVLVEKAETLKSLLAPHIIDELKKLLEEPSVIE